MPPKPVEPIPPRPESREQRDSVDENDIELKTEKVVHFAEHEFLIAFTADDMAVEFSYWWQEVGEKLFIEHYNSLDEANQ